MNNAELMKKAQELIGSWVYDKAENEYLYIYDWVQYNKGSVKVCCIAIYTEDAIIYPYIRQKEIAMFEFDEYCRKVSDTKCIKEWEKFKKYYDKLFKGE